MVHLLEIFCGSEKAAPTPCVCAGSEHQQSTLLVSVVPGTRVPSTPWYTGPVDATRYQVAGPTAECWLDHEQVQEKSLHALLVPVSHHT